MQDVNKGGDYLSIIDEVMKNENIPNSKKHDIITTSCPLHHGYNNCDKRGADFHCTVSCKERWNRNAESNIIK